MTNKISVSLDLKNFIIANEPTITKQDFETLYENAKRDTNLTGDDVGTLTILLLKYVNPLKDLKYVPEYFLQGAKLDSYTISDHITEIFSNAFFNCDIKTIFIPKSVTSINDCAFMLASNTEIIYEGTEKDFDNIDIAPGNDVLDDRDKITYQGL